MSEMKPGDVGYLQHLSHRMACLNGTPATVIGVYEAGDQCKAEWADGGPEVRTADGPGYFVRLSLTPCPGYPQLCIYRYQIRPWHNPDQETEVDQAEEVSA